MAQCPWEQDHQWESPWSEVSGAEELPQESLQVPFPVLKPWPPVAPQVLVFNVSACSVSAEPLCCSTYNLPTLAPHSSRVGPGGQSGSSELGHVCCVVAVGRGPERVPAGS